MPELISISSTRCAPVLNLSCSFAGITNEPISSPTLSERRSPVPSGCAVALVNMFPGLSSRVANLWKVVSGLANAVISFPPKNMKCLVLRLSPFTLKKILRALMKGMNDTSIILSATISLRVLTSPRTRTLPPDGVPIQRFLNE